MDYKSLINKEHVFLFSVFMNTIKYFGNKSMKNQTMEQKNKRAVLF